MNTLEGKIAIVTGSARGIGREIALRFAEAGCTLSLCDLNYEGVLETSRMAEKFGVKAIALRTDVTNRSEVTSMVASTVDKLGVPNILVNNAGIFFNATFEEMSDEQWHRMMDANLTSVFLVSQVVIRHWLEHKLPGVIVNMSSLVAEMAFTNSSHYITSKTAVYGLTRAIARDYATRGIRANAIAPGIIESDMSRPALGDPVMVADWMRHIFLGRLGQPKDIAETALFLASDASSYTTGQLLTVDGGWLLD
jgi:3-oxoacyl-[acyl-carrier protein] reductase